jgi:hypothetical protein
MKLRRQRRKGCEHLTLRFKGINHRHVDREEGHHSAHTEDQRNQQGIGFF